MRITSLAVAIYVPLSLISLAWAWLGQDRLAWVGPSSWIAASEGTRVAVSIAAGLSLAAAVVLTTPVLVERAAWARSLQAEMKPLVDSLSAVEIHALALVSGLAEELFFRGAMQPVLGLIVTSLLFGAVHTGPKRIFIAWSFWAFVMGLLFGLIFEATGSLWGPVLAHVLINDRNLAYMKGH